MIRVERGGPKQSRAGFLGVYVLRSTYERRQLYLRRTPPGFSDFWNHVFGVNRNPEQYSWNFLFLIIFQSIPFNTKLNKSRRKLI